MRNVGKLTRKPTSAAVMPEIISNGQKLTPNFVESIAPVSYTHLDVYKRQAIPATAPIAAHVAPQNADSLPILVFWWIAIKFPTHKARNSKSLETPISCEYTQIGTLTAIP